MEIVAAGSPFAPRCRVDAESRTQPTGFLPNLLLVGDGRLARHLTRYFEQLGLSHATWSRRGQAEGRCAELDALVHAGTRALLAISDGAIEPFIAAHPELEGVVRI